jgi:hypothetical protein
MRSNSIFRLKLSVWSRAASGETVDVELLVAQGHAVSIPIAIPISISIAITLTAQVYRSFLNRHYTASPASAAPACIVSATRV